MSETPTPRTNAEAIVLYGLPGVHIDFSRMLERELAEARSSYADLKARFVKIGNELAEAKELLDREQCAHSTTTDLLKGAEAERDEAREALREAEEKK